MNQDYEILKNLEDAKAGLAYSLAVFGDELAKAQQYKEHKGIDAIHFYLIEKFNWLPSVVRSMTTDDMRFCLAEEMSGWVLPPNAR